MAIELRGHLYNNAGAALQNADVALFATSVNADESTSDSSAEDTAQTSSTGLWTFSEATQGKYDVRITSGTSIRWRRYNESVQMEEIEVAMLAMRNPGDTFKYDITPGAISADQVLNLPVTTQTTTVVSTPVEDNVLLSLGAGGDAVMLNRSTALSADTELSNVIVGTSDHPGVAANSLIISNITTDGDIMFAVSDGGNSKGLLLIDGSEGLIVPHGSIVPSATNTIDLGTSSLEFKDAFFDGTVTSDAFAGPLTGNVTGNASGTAATVTGGTQASITTVANVVEVGALDAGSITSGFGAIDTGSSNITTTGTVSAEQLTSTDDLSLTGDGAVFNMGAGPDFTITHDGTTGATLAGNPITITSGGAGTWSTSAGALTVNGAGGVNIQEGGATIIGINDSRALSSTNTASIDWDATGAITVNSSGGTISVANDNVDQVVNLATAGTRTLNVGINDGTDVTTIVSKGNITNTGTLTVGADDTGHDVVFHGATANAELRWDESDDGLILNQGTSDEKILSLKGSDINTGFTSGTNKTVEATDFATFTKRNATHGGLQIQAMAADEVTNNVLRVHAYGGQANTAKTTGAEGLIHFQVAESTGSNALATIEANGNVFVVTGYVDLGSGAGHKARFVVDEDGELLAASATVGTFDEYDDAHLVRALDQTKGDAIRSRWDDYVQYNEQSLVDAGILGASVYADDGTVAERGLLNVTGLQRLHNGAIWQGHVKQQEMQERIDTLENKLLALEAK